MIWHNAPADTLLKQGVTEGLAYAGVNRETADRIGLGVDLTADVASAVLTLKAPKLSFALKETENTSSLALRLEANAGRRLVELETYAGSRAHFVSRHGTQTTIEQQYIRATTGLTPDGIAGRVVDSSRFLGNRAQLNAIQAAEEIFGRTGQRVFTFDAGYTIGEGFLRGGSDLVRTTNIHAVFDVSGKLRTLFPWLSPLP